MEDFIFDLGNESTLYKLDELILRNCVSFDCGVEDLNDFFANDSIAYITIVNLIIRSTWLLRIKLWRDSQRVLNDR